jgi:hypothetical protein
MMESNDQTGAGSDQPTMIQAFAQLTRQLSAIREDQAADREAYRTQIQAIQELLVQRRQTPSPPNPPPELLTPNITSRQPSPPPIGTWKKKATLPDPPRFDGTRKNFRTWQLEIRSKLRVDGPVLGLRADQFAYIYARLDQAAQAMAAAYYEKGGPDGAHDPDQFLAYLTACYGDPNAEQRALSRLETMRQGEKESFSTFLPKFEKELADSGGAEWNDTVRINSLRRVINHDLRTHLAGQLSLPREYPAFVNAVQNLGANLDDLRFHEKKQQARPLTS